MRHLVVCCDGTWNTREQQTTRVPTPTNVVRLYNALDDVDGDGHEQVRYYHPGVGTDGSWIDRLVAGGLGVGLSHNIMSAYHWLAVHYRPGDRISVFGFSRGAYTVRSLAGMIATCGLLDLADADPAEAWRRVDRAYDVGYRPPTDRRAGRGWAGRWPFHHGPEGAPVAVHLVGVWDTVGALGIPDTVGLIAVLNRDLRHRFHDTTLSRSIRCGRHAVAMDETRGPFTPTLWTDPQPGQDVAQVWFPGDHSDVGGGHPQSGLSDGALRWMIEEAGKSAGLAFRPTAVDQIAPDYLDVLHDSCTGIYRQLSPQPRAVPVVARDRSPGVMHSSAFDRQDNPPITASRYWPTRVLRPGESATVDVFARQEWNATGLYLEPGGYAFTATGQWLDGRMPADAAGHSDSRLHPEELAHMAGSALGVAERLAQRIPGNELGEFPATRRAEDLPWMSLVGVVANWTIQPEPDEPPRHDRFGIGTDTRFTVLKPGYLYAFANDAWGLYGNNRGSVALTVTRAGS
ncbi:phospholipase effector Tle1 domain-containing protein [Pseudonocardia acidicola]|uniref:DUF2235 domain-containing protein n=1 Tax=Pseudonocardia acidicola TaxID=2724939 RepID=A0ABX1SJS2_9PSEU|nr:DUF2235 domain-containing protein [Pseudonocardia acidicola]